MTAETSLLAFGLVMIFCAAEGLTNGIEALGRRFSLSQAVVGSVLAAVGTALPETILPMVAIFLYEAEAAQKIGVGAILGAPFMLSTLAFFLVGLTVAVSALAKKRSFSLVVETHSLRRDIIFFLLMYSLAVLLPLIAGKIVALPIAILLVVGYIFYAYQTFRSESAAIEHTGEMYIWKLLEKLSIAKVAVPGLTVILIQVIGALSVMVAGAHTFVKSLAHVSESFGIKVRVLVYSVGSENGGLLARIRLTIEPP